MPPLCLLASFLAAVLSAQPLPIDAVQTTVQARVEADAERAAAIFSAWGLTSESIQIESLNGPTSGLAHERATLRVATMLDRMPRFLIAAHPVKIVWMLGRTARS